MEKYDFNQGWRFHRGNLDEKAFLNEYDDSRWENVCLPHTARLEPVMASGMKNYTGKAWYRKHFIIGEELKGKKLYITFEGAMHYTEVRVNGIKKKENFCGYLPFVIDITDDVCFGGENIISVMTDNSDNPDIPPGKPQIELDFCYFGGLYRNAYLEAADPVHITNELFEDITAGGGVFVSYDNVSKESADIRVDTHIRNETNIGRGVQIEYFLNGKAGGVQTEEICNDKTVTKIIHVKNPSLWSLEKPYLYELKICCSSENFYDERILKIGIRNISFDKHDCRINGEKVFLSGCNRHQEYPYIGNALPDSLQRRDAAIIKNAGWNIVRTGHYPCAGAFAEECDKLGILIITPTPGWQFYPTENHELFDSRVYKNTRQMVRFLRNHPCAAIWEPVINEEGKTPNVFRRINYNAVHEEYPYADCYCSIDEEYDTEQLYDLIYKKTAEKNPSKPGFTREYGDNWKEQYDGTEPKLYRVNREENAFGGFYRGGKRAMLENMLARTAAEGINGEERELVRSLKGQYMVHDSGLSAGCCIWAGFDHNRGYSSNPAVVGVLDFFRLPKYQYYAFRAQNKNGAPMIYAVKYENYLWVLSNCDSVRVCCGEKEVCEQSTSDKYLPSKPLRFDLSGFSGEWCCYGITGGKITVSCHEIHVKTGKRIRIHYDMMDIPFTADGSDKLMIYADVVDGDGNICEDEQHEIRFEAENLKIVENSRIKSNPARTSRGTCAVLAESVSGKCRAHIRASAKGLETDEIEINLSAFDKKYIEYIVSPFAEENLSDNEEEQISAENRTNIARHKSAFASSGNPLCGNDGSFNTEWAADISDKNPEWTVDLEKEEYISEMRIYWGDDSTTYTYEILLGDGAKWQSVFHGNGTGQDTKKIPIHEKARLVKIKIPKTSKGTAAFMQIEIYP